MDATSSAWAAVASAAGCNAQMRASGARKQRKRQARWSRQQANNAGETEEGCIEITIEGCIEATLYRQNGSSRIINQW